MNPAAGPRRAPRPAASPAARSMPPTPAVQAASSACSKRRSLAQPAELVGQERRPRRRGEHDRVVEQARARTRCRAGRGRVRATRYSLPPARIVTRSRWCVRPSRRRSISVSSADRSHPAMRRASFSGPRTSTARTRSSAFTSLGPSKRPATASRHGSRPAHARSATESARILRRGHAVQPALARVDDHPRGEPRELGGQAALVVERPLPPQEHGQVGHEQRRHGARKRLGARRRRARARSTPGGRRPRPSTSSPPTRAARRPPASRRSPAADARGRRARAPRSPPRSAPASGRGRPG